MRIASSDGIGFKGRRVSDRRLIYSQQSNRVSILIKAMHDRTSSMEHPEHVPRNPDERL